MSDHIRLDKKYLHSRPGLSTIDLFEAQYGDKGLSRLSYPPKSLLHIPEGQVIIVYVDNGKDQSLTVIQDNDDLVIYKSSGHISIIKIWFLLPKSVLHRVNPSIRLGY